MFPMEIPPLPDGFMDVIATNPEAFGECMGAGQEAFANAMNEGGDVGAAFEAMGDVMGPMMGDMGCPPEMFEAAGDAFGACVGPAMHMGDADMSGGDMGAIMQDACTMMCPDGMEVPAPVMDAMMDMGQGMHDCGCMPHDAAAEMMAPPGDPAYPMPVDGAGEAVVVPGDPGSCPAEACQPPPVDGACAAAGDHMMPPDGGYDHAAMTPDMQMPDPGAAMGPEIDPAANMDPGAPGPEAGGFDPNLAPDSQVGPMDPGAPGPEAGGFDPNLAPDSQVGPMDSGAADAMGAAMGGDPAAGPMAPPPDSDAAADAAVTAALDGAAASNAGAPPPPQGPEAPMDAPMDPAADMPNQPEDDGSAGMG